MNPEADSIIRPLNAADYFTLAMDAEIRREGLPGSLCGFALELDSVADPEALRHRIDRFTQHYPTSRACLKKIGRHYYWCKRPESPPIFHHHDYPDSEPWEPVVRSGVASIMAQQQSLASVNPLEFHLLSNGRQSVLLIRWLHPFCDARGAELIIRYLCGGELPAGAEPPPLLESRLKKFSLWQRLQLFLKARRLIESIDRQNSIVPIADNAHPEQLDYAVFRFSLQETERIQREIGKHTGIAATSLYYIGSFMRVLDSTRPGAPGNAYCVPYAFNLRPQNALQPLTGNHVGVLFAQAERSQVQNREALFGWLRQQYRESIRNRLDYAFMPLMAMGRWLSLPRYGRVLRQSFETGGERSSFWFSDLGRLNDAVQQCAGANISGVFQLCHISTPPALGFFTCVFKGQLTLTYIFNKPQFDSGQIRVLHEKMREELVGAP